MSIIPVKPIVKALSKDANAPVEEVIEQAAKPMPDLLPDLVIPEADLAAMRAADESDAAVKQEIPEEEITVYHGTPHEFPPVTELVSHVDGSRVYVDSTKYPDWTQHPDLKPADYEFVKQHELGAFDSSKIGTGEGAQAYGHGLYFAEQKITAESYQGLAKGWHIDGSQPRLRSDVEDYAADYANGQPRLGPYYEVSNPDGLLLQKVRELEQSGEPVREAALKEIDEKIKELDDLALAGSDTSDRLLGLKDLRKLVEEEDLSKFKYEKGSLYEVKIKAKQEEFLELDDVIGDQDQPLVERIFDSNPKLKGLLEDAEDYYTPSGENATGYSVLRVLQETFEPQEYADILSNAGIKGFKYKDAQTRFSRKGATYNYVVFDDKIVDIAKKYGVSLFAAGSISLGLMTPQQAQAQENPIGAPMPEPGTPEATADDTGSDFIEAYNRENLSPGEMLVQQRNANKAQEQSEKTFAQKNVETIQTVGRGISSVAKDIGSGVLEAPERLAVGVMSGLAEFSRTLDAITPDSLKKLTPTYGKLFPALLQYLDKKDYEPIGLSKESETVSGGVVQGVSQFLSTFIPTMYATRGAGLTKSAPYISGFIADATAFDANEARLSDLAIELGIDNEVTQYLASDEDDTMFEGKLKNGLEGLGIGAFADMLFYGIKAFKRSKNLQDKADDAGQTVEEFVGPRLPEIVGPKKPEELRPEDIDQFVGPNLPEIPGPNLPEIPGPRLPEDALPATAGRGVGQVEPDFVPFETLADDAAAEVPAPKPKGEGVDADVDAAQNININRLETTEDVKKFINDAAEADPLSVNEARRGKIEQETTEQLANDLGMTVAQLLKRRAGEAFNAEQALAARRLLVASGENLMKLAEQAKNGGDVAVALFRRAMSQHRAIQLEVSGMTAEAGRALQAFRIMAGSSDEQMKAIKEALDATGGLEVNQDIAKRFADITDPKDIGKYVKDVHVATVKDMVEEFWINSLLSALGTHVMNITSNSTVVVSSILERKVAGVFGKEIANNEANAMFMGIIEGARDGFKLAKKTLKTGDPSDQLQKQEIATKRSITGQQMGLSGSMAKGVNFLGNVIRLPGRALMASDEFFKAVAYRMELHAQAYRLALREGLEGDDFVARVQGVLENPPKDIRMEAANFARYQTFTNELGKTASGEALKRQPGKAWTKLRSDLGIVGTVIFPFIRTPVNVVKWASARSPLAPLMPSVHADIAAGGARKELALSRIGLGSMFMTVSAMMAQKGQITGQGPTNYEERAILEMNGWKPNSILIGEKYISLDRADPIAQTLLMAANVTEVFAQADDENTYMDIGMAAVITVANGLTSKTFYNGLIDFVDGYAGASRNPDDKQNSVIKWAENLGASVIPSGVAAVARNQDPALRLTNGLVDKLKARLPGYREGLPPRRNMFGEVIVPEGGLGPDIMSPFYQSTKKYNSVVDEMIEHRVAPGMPRKTIEGIELTTEQYDRFVQLSARPSDKLQSIEQALKAVMSQSFYKRATGGENGMKPTILRGVINDYRRQALYPLFEEFPNLKSDVAKARIKNQEDKTGRQVSESAQRRMGVLSGEVTQ